VSATLTKPMTADELLVMPDDGYRYELVKGELIRMAPAGYQHGVRTVELTTALHSHIKAHKLGVVCAAETGFLLSQDPDTVRAPDIAFIARNRVEKAGAVKSYWIGPPDLAVEVTSPGDTVRQVEEKVAEWLAAETKMVWVVSPKLHTVTVYRSLTDIATLTEKDVLDGGDVVPGFKIEVAKIFAT
jgi:Uma2 family endonuclease